MFITLYLIPATKFFLSYYFSFFFVFLLLSFSSSLQPPFSLNSFLKYTSTPQEYKCSKIHFFNYFFLIPVSILLSTAGLKHFLLQDILHQDMQINLR